MAMSTHRSLRLTVLWTALLGFAVDQGTKWLIMNVVMQPPTVIPVLPFFNLRLGFNTGVSFGLFNETFADAPALLAGLMLVIVVMLAIWALRAQTFTEALGLGLVISGALGNIIDRLRIGASSCRRMALANLQHGRYCDRHRSCSFNVRRPVRSTARGRECWRISILTTFSHDWS